MTIRELVKDLQTLVRDGHGDLPVNMFSDEEGNGYWPLASVGFDVDDAEAIVAVVMVPGHEPVEGWEA